MAAAAVFSHLLLQTVNNVCTHTMHINTDIPQGYVLKSMYGCTTDDAQCHSIGLNQLLHNVWITWLASGHENWEPIKPTCCVFAIVAGLFLHCSNSCGHALLYTLLFQFCWLTRVLSKNILKSQLLMYRIMIFWDCSNRIAAFITGFNAWYLSQIPGGY